MQTRRKGMRRSYLKKRVWDVSEVTAVLAGRGFVVTAISDATGCTIVAIKGDSRHKVRIEYGKLVMFKGDEPCV